MQLDELQTLPTGSHWSRVVLAADEGARLSAHPVSRNWPRLATTRRWESEVRSDGNLQVPCGRNFSSSPIWPFANAFIGVDDDRPDALPVAYTQDPVDDRHDVGQRLARPRTGGHHVVVSCLCRPEGVDLVVVRRERGAAPVVVPCREDVDTTLVQQAIRTRELVDRRTDRELRVDLDPRVRP